MGKIMLRMIQLCSKSADISHKSDCITYKSSQHCVRPRSSHKLRYMVRGRQAGKPGKSGKPRFAEADHIGRLQNRENRYG